MATICEFGGHTGPHRRVANIYDYDNPRVATVIRTAMWGYDCPPREKCLQCKIYREQILRAWSQHQPLYLPRFK